MSTPTVRTTQTADTFIGGPETGRTRREAWEAEVEHDGHRWSLIRLDKRGTPWQVVHADTGIEVGGWHGSRRKAAAWIATGAARRVLLDRDLPAEADDLQAVADRLAGDDHRISRENAARYAARAAAVRDLIVRSGTATA